jgi:hypothetical protein
MHVLQMLIQQCMDCRSREVVDFDLHGMLPFGSARQ